MANSAIVGILKALLTADAGQFVSALEDSAKAAQAWSRDLQQIGRQATSLGSSLTKTLTVPLAGLGLGAAKLAIDFESSFAGVRKTVNATEPEFQAMADSFRQLSKTIPVNVNDLNRLGEAAGALGIPKQKIVEFARVMAELGVTTNLTADQAAESIAKIQNIFGAAGQDTERFASTLVALGNDGASTESQIVEMATRIAGAGHAINISQGEVLAFASALSSVGIDAEAGGSAISRVFIDIQAAVSKGGSALNSFAEVAGMSSAQFSKAFKDDAARAVDSFITGLGKIKQSGGDLLGTVNDLGFSEIRVRDTLLRAAGAGDLLTKALDLQKQSWSDNTALTKEAEQRFKTTESQLTLLWNRVKDVGITFGNAMKPAIDLAIKGFDHLIPIIDQAGKFFAAMPAPVQLAVLGVGALAAAIGPLLWVFGQIVTSGSQVIGLFTRKGLAMRLLKTDTEALSGAFGVLSKAVGGITLAFAAVEAGMAIGRAHTAHLDALTKSAEDLSQAEGLIAEKEAEVAKARQYGNDKLEFKLSAELAALKAGRDAAVQAVAQAKAEQELADQKVANAARDKAAADQAEQNAVKRKTAAQIISEAEQQYQKNIADTGLSVAQLTSLLKTNESGFDAVVKAHKLDADTVKYLKDNLQAQTDAQKKAKDSAKDLEEQTKKNTEALEKFGLITKDKVNEELAQMAVDFKFAVDHGVKMGAFLDQAIPKLVELGKKAKASGLDVRELESALKTAREELSKMPPPSALTTLAPFDPSTLANLGIAVKTMATVPTTAQFAAMAMKDLGITSQKSLQDTARAAEQSWKDIVAVYGSGSKEAGEAFQRMIAAQIAAGERLPQSLRFDIALQSIQDISSAIGGKFASAVSFSIGSVQQLSKAMAVLNSSTASAADQAVAAANVYVLLATVAIKAATTIYNQQRKESEAARAANRKALLESSADQEALFKKMFEQRKAAMALPNGAGDAFLSQLDAFAQQFIDQASKTDAVWSKTFLSFIDQAKAAGYEIQGLTELFEKQRTALAGASGNVAKDLATTVQASFEAQTSAAIKAFDAQIAAAQDNEATVKHLEAEKAAYIADKQQEIVASTQEEFDRISRIVLNSFNTIVAGGGSPFDAITQIGPGFDELAKAADQFGFAGNAAFEQIARWRDLTVKLQPTLDQMSGLNTILATTANLGGLSAEAFADLQAQGVSAYQALIEGGMTQQEAELSAKPLLEQIIQLHKDKGLAIDEATQKLIDQAKQDGIVRDQEETTQQVLKEGLGAIIKALKGDVPAAWKDMAEDAKTQMGDIEANAKSAGKTIAGAFNQKFNIPVGFDVAAPPSSAPSLNPDDAFQGFAVPMARGGIVRQPTFAMVGEAGPEAVIPLKDYNGGAGGTMAIVFEIDGQRVGRAVTPFVAGESKRLRLTR